MDQEYVLEVGEEYLDESALDSEKVHQCIHLQRNSHSLLLNRT